MNMYLLAAVQSAESGTKIGIGDAAVTAIFGYCVVFFGLVLLMCVLYITGSIFKSKESKAAAAKVDEKIVEKKPEPVPEPPAPAAPGSAGHVKLYNVPDKEAAMIMAIVADKMQTPLNELRFISIKEVK
ncbi:MAG: OadG family protein [Ruminococcus sp.]|nr:OadG family protein [Ruminococcus sp.]MDE7225496.1 OadG family protein [Ruminococcus sp.]